MSVINKMLRDLDQRQAKTLPAAISATQPIRPGALSSRRGAERDSRGGSAQAIGRQRWVLWWIGISLLLAAVAGWLWQNHVAASGVFKTEPLAVSAMPVVAVVTAKSIPPVAAPAVVVLPVAPGPASPALSALSAAVRTDTKPDAAAHAVTLGLRLDTHLLSRKFTDRMAVSERAVNPKPDALGSGANDALERAQTLWNTGSRDAALGLLQDAVAVAERQGAGAGSFPQGNAALLPLVRELTRMQLAEARHSAVWELLTRLELQLGQVPDLWAIRANAAQRLGQHQDSVHAYLVALQSRPNEPRWLLGAAVSLAALGQSSSAAEMADKASAVGVVSPDVLAYLRQQGVALKDR